MDPITDLPPMTTEPEPYAGIPPPPLAPNHAHPPYSEMITAAITALNDKDGSSRQAIAKFIEKEYANLPPTHSALLTHHLKRMKNEGQLMMLKHSYALPPNPRSGYFQPPSSNFYANNTDYSATGTGTGTAMDSIGFAASIDAGNTSSALPKKRPGRPPKLRTDSGFQLPEVQPLMAEGEVQPYQPQFQHQLGAGMDFQPQNHFGANAAGQDLHPHYGSGPDFQGDSVGAAEPIFVSLGLSDEGIAAPLAPQPENALVPVKRGRGRPPKIGGGGGGDGGVVMAGRRGPRRKAGRPKLMSIMMGNGGVKKGRGRPKRSGIGPVTVPLSGNVMRPRGRPRRAVGRPRSVAVSGGVGETGFVSRRLGRPPKNGGGANKILPGTAVLVTDPQQLVAYQELKFKYEHLQSKAKEVASVVKPYINPDYGSAALGALQELETLAGTNTTNEPPSEDVPSHEPPPSFIQN